MDRDAGLWSKLFEAALVRSKKAQLWNPGVDVVGARLPLKRCSQIPRQHRSACSA